jgi:hypothetical protein
MLRICAVGSFAGLLEIQHKAIIRPDGEGAQMGMTYAQSSVLGLFLGTSAPSRLQDLILRLRSEGPGISRSSLELCGLRNAIVDASALGLVLSRDGNIFLSREYPTESALLSAIKDLIRNQSTVKTAVQCMRDTENRKDAAKLLASQLDASWNTASSIRYLGGLVRYAAWAEK